MFLRFAAWPPSRSTVADLIMIFRVRPGRAARKVGKSCGCRKGATHTGRPFRRQARLSLRLRRRLHLRVPIRRVRAGTPFTIPSAGDAECRFRLSFVPHI